MECYGQATTLLTDNYKTNNHLNNKENENSSRAAQSAD